MVSIPKLILFMKAVGSTFAISVSTGLPNIVGYLGNSFDHGTFNQISGVFGKDSYSLRAPADGGGPYNGLSKFIYFNATRSSSIYGNSSTVTPLSRSTLYILKY